MKCPIMEGRVVININISCEMVFSKDTSFPRIKECKQLGWGFFIHHSRSIPDSYH